MNSRSIGCLRPNVHALRKSRRRLSASVLCFLACGRVLASLAVGAEEEVPPSVAFGTPGLELQPFVIDHRGAATVSMIDLSFLLEAPAGRDGFLQVQGGHVTKPNGAAVRFWGVNVTEWSRGSTAIPTKEDAPIWAGALARHGINLVRLHFLDLPTPRGMIDDARNDSQHFDAGQLDREDFFIAALLQRGIYVNWNLNVGRRFKDGDHVLATRVGKGPLLFNRRLIELQKDYARQVLTHVNPYTGRAYVDEPGVAIVEIVNEDAIYVGWTQDGPYDQELTDLYNDWLVRNLSAAELTNLRRLLGVAGEGPVPRLQGPAVRAAPAEQYYTESRFFRDLQAGYFQEMERYLQQTLGVRCPIVATADHAHSGSGYALVADTALLDIVDGHTYWMHPGDRRYRHAPMVNDPANSTVAELARTAVAGQPYTVSEVNNPYPNQFSAEGVPILAAYAGFLDWDAVVWYTFEPKRDANWGSYVGDPFDVSLDPIKMTQLAAGALMFLRGDIARAQITHERTYTRQQVLDSRRTPGLERPFFTPGFPATLPLRHGVRVRSFDGEPTSPVDFPREQAMLTSDTGELIWSRYEQAKGVVTIDSPRSQALVGFLPAGAARVTNLSADVRNTFCALVLSSLEPETIARSRRLLLTAGARVENTGMQWDAARARVTEQGRAPTLIEPVTGQITLHDLAEATAVSVQPLDGAGHALGAPQVGIRSGAGWQFSVGAPATTWYLIHVER